MNDNLVKARAQRQANYEQRRQQPVNIQLGKLLKQLEQRDMEIVNLQVEMMQCNTISALCDRLQQQLEVEQANLAPMYAYILKIVCICTL